MRETKPVIVQAQWIWDDNHTKPNDWMIFRKTFFMEALPEQAFATISADTRYWLYINGKLAVFEGGLFRESMPGCGYADIVDLSPYLHRGENVLAALVWYFGNDGRNSVDSGHAGFLFDCKAIGLFSDSTFLCHRHTGYFDVTDSHPSSLYGGHDIGYRLGSEMARFSSPDFDDSGFSPAVIYPKSYWGELYERPIPLFRLNPPSTVQAVPSGENCWRVALPYAMTFSPLIKLLAKGGEKIDVFSDRYVVTGGPGDHHHQYIGYKMQFICQKGENLLQSVGYLYGEAMIISSDSPLELLEIQYQESGYNCNIVGSFDCGDTIVNRLFHKSARTLYVCMRDNFMDCPDRERGQWIGDVSVQAPQAMLLLGEEAHQLVRKGIYDFIQLRQGDTLVGNVPGAHCGELPSQSLNAISEWGMLAFYYRYSGDLETIKMTLEPSFRYLSLWELGSNGLIVSRKGNWQWFDHLFNVDAPVLENAWYYSALKFIRSMFGKLGEHSHDGFFDSRMASIQQNFERCFWKGNYYASGDFVDDRANAMAVLAGLCPQEHYAAVKDILLSVHNATVYMENYILSALCEMGYCREAHRRMVSRYYPLAVNENTTLWEDFNILGTKNHAWSGAPATIALRYFLGLDTNDGYQTFTLHPDRELFRKMDATFQAKGGTVHVVVDNERGTVTVENHSQSRYVE